MKKIALIHFRSGFTDGVSLEMNKWEIVLKELGHEVYYVSGEAKNEAFIIEEMNLNSVKFKMFFNNCYVALKDFKNEKLLEEAILLEAKIIEDKLFKIIKKNKIDLLIPNNVSSLGLHLPTGIAIANIIKKTNIKVVYHHHDFYFERERYNNPTASFINDLLLNYFPYNNENTTHVVINKIAQRSLIKMRNINSTVIPNVFDFKQKKWEIDDYNKDLKGKLGIKENDLVFLQATRIEDRKAIEIALDVVKEVYLNRSKLVNNRLYNGKVFNNDSKIHLIIAGLNELVSDKFELLNNKIIEMPFKVHLISDMVGAARSETPKKYSLWDIYPHADFVTYPSILEGWGNQLIEALFSKKPVIVYKYPVYKTDIKKYKFKVVSLGSKYEIDKNGLKRISDFRIKKASNKIINLLKDNKKYEKITESNFKKAFENLSFENLKTKIKNVINNI